MLNLKKLKNAFVCLTVLMLCGLTSASTPARAQMPVSPQALQGAWAGSNGRDSLILMFTGNTCAMGMNGQQMAGVWNLTGDRLDIRFQNGKTVSYNVAVEGDALLLDGNMRLMRQTMPGMANASAPMPNYGGQPQGGAWGGQPQQNFGGQSPLEGTWVTQAPQGTRAFRFAGNRYAQLLNGQVFEEGVFAYSPDGRFQYQVTSGQYAGQRGEDRITINGNSITVAWPEGTVVTFMRDGMGQRPGEQGGWGQTGAFGNATPLEGHWMWAKNGPVTFGFVFSGNRFISLWNGAEKSRGTFALSGMQLTMRHESGPDAGKTDVLGYRLNGNRLLIFTSQDPNIDPIPFTRQ